MPLRQLVVLPPTASVDEIFETTDRDGGVIVEDFIAADVIDRVNRDFEPYLAALTPAEGYSGDDGFGGFYGRRTKRMQSLVARSDAVVDCILHQTLMQWVQRELDDPGDFQLNTGQLMEIGPGEPAQELHADAWNWRSASALPNRNLIVNCMVALSDFTESNGATRVIPGSHREDLSTWDWSNPPETVPAEMRAGSVLLFTGRLVHGGGANITADEWRRGMSLSFLVGWLRAEEANCLTVSPERAKQLPVRMRELLGFKSYVHKRNGKPMSHLWIYDMQDASQVLVDGPAR